MLENEANQPHLLETQDGRAAFTMRNGAMTSITLCMCC